MASEDRSLSEFPRALEVLSNCLLMISNPDGLGGYDTNNALLTEVGRTILGVQYTQQLGNVSVFDAIKNTRVLSGTTTPTAIEGANGQLYVKYETVSNVDSVVGMYFKKDGAWLEISLGGGGNTDYIECTQAQYDSWEQGGTLDPDTLYFITDGNIGNDIIDDSTASETTVYSSDKVEDLLSDKADLSDIVTSNFWKTEKLTIANSVSVGAGVETQPTTVAVPQYAGYTVLTFTEVRATGYHGAKVTVQAELSSTTELVYALYNPSNVNATVTVTVRVIYVKTIA